MVVTVPTLAAICSSYLSHFEAIGVHNLSQQQLTDVSTVHLQAGRTCTALLSITLSSGLLICMVSNLCQFLCFGFSSWHLPAQVSVSKEDSGMHDGFELDQDTS